MHFLSCYLSSAAISNHGDGSLDTEGVSLPVTEPLHLPLKLCPLQESQLTCVLDSAQVRRKIIIEILEAKKNEDQKNETALWSGAINTAR